MTLSHVCPILNPLDPHQIVKDAQIMLWWDTCCLESQRLNCSPRGCHGLTLPLKGESSELNEFFECSAVPSWTSEGHCTDEFKMRFYSVSRRTNVTITGTNSTVSVSEEGQMLGSWQWLLRIDILTLLKIMTMELIFSSNYLNLLLLIHYISY